MSKSRGLLSFIVALTLCAQAQAKEHHEKHVHGEAELELAVESEKVLSVEFHVPADSIVGFEHEAKSTADKKKVEAAIVKFRNGLTSLLKPAGKITCQSSAINVHVEKEEHEDGEEEHEKGEKKEEKGEHSEFQSEYKLTCDTGVKGQNFRVDPSAISKKIQRIEAKVVGESGSSGAEISAKGGSISIP